MTEFKQIIGRGTRVRDDYGKLFFSILDYTGSATRLFADPEFDGDPMLITEEEIDEEGGTTAITEGGSEDGGADDGKGGIEGPSGATATSGRRVSSTTWTAFR
jgi:type I restriction enzyme, R subunit